jgi:AraC-like DNA-binding protein
MTADLAARLDCSTLPQPMSAGISRVEAGRQMAAHELSLFELNFIASGSYPVLLNGEEHHAVAGGVYAYRPGDVAGSPGADAGGIVCHWVKFTWPQTRVTLPLALARGTMLDAGQRTRFVETFSRLLELHQGGRTETRLAASAALLELLAIVAEAAAAPARVPDRRLSRALELIERGFAKPLLMRELAEAAGLTEDYFTRLFRRELGVPPMQHLIRRRLGEARRLLAEDPRLGVAEAARRSGFDDPGHFTRLFRRHFGVAPREFRSRLD